MRGEIERHFKIVLNRPEILNRIGDNILVFDFIRPDVARQIFDVMVDSVLCDVSAAQGIDITLDSGVRDALRDLCLADVSNGGRGISATRSRPISSIHLPEPSSIPMRAPEVASKFDGLTLARQT